MCIFGKSMAAVLLCQATVIIAHFAVISHWWMQERVSLVRLVHHANNCHDTINFVVVLFSLILPHKNGVDRKCAENEGGGQTEIPTVLFSFYRVWPRTSNKKFSFFFVCFFFCFPPNFFVCLVGPTFPVVAIFLQTSEHTDE